MVIQLHPLYNGEVDELPFSFTFTPESTDADVAFVGDGVVKGRVYMKARGKTKEESYVELQVSITAPYQASCARCTKPIARDFVYSADYCVSSEPDIDEYQDIVFAKDRKIDLLQLASDIVMLHMPMRHLCKEDCKGICFGCGADQNEEECRCQQKKGDPRLAILQKLLDKDEK